MRQVMAIAAALLAAQIPVAQAALYKCKQDGRTIYSDRACPGDQAAPRQLPQATRPDPLNAQRAAKPAQRAEPAAADPEAAASPAAEQAGQPPAPRGTAAAGAPAPTGRKVMLLDGQVALTLASAFRYLDENQSRRVLVEVWGNPPESAEGVLGMILPANVDPADPQGWGVVITYTGDGYVSDEDASDIDYTELLREMQQESAAENEARAAQGYPTVTLAGWAEPPHYDAGTHKIYWAKDLIFGEGPDHTLNYAIRVLGREGVLELNAVAGTHQLASVKRSMEHIVGFAEFTDGNRYADYNESTDRRAAYGIAALVAGGVAAKKIGLFALIAALAVKFWKLVAIGVVGLLGLLKATSKKR